MGEGAGSVAVAGGGVCVGGAAGVAGWPQAERIRMIRTEKEVNFMWPSIAGISLYYRDLCPRSDLAN